MSDALVAASAVALLIEKDAELARIRAELEVAQAFHAVAVKERDAERRAVDRLRAENERLEREVTHWMQEANRDHNLLVKMHRLVMTDEPMTLEEGIRALQASHDQCRARVEKLMDLLHRGAWHRHRDYPGKPVGPQNRERTYLAMQMHDGADLSCTATREAAIDAALKEHP